MEFGARIRTRRNGLDWSQEELARRAGISKGFLSDVENGKRGIRAETLLDLARVLGLSIDFLMTGEEGEEEQRRSEIEVPASLAEYASDAGLSFRTTLMLLDMRRQIIAHRSTRDREPLGQIDWHGFYESVKEFL